MRVKRGYVLRRRHNRVLKLAKGYFGSHHILWKTAHQSVIKALRNAYVGRKDKKNDYRKLWIGRISAACKANNTSYSVFMHGLNVAKINLNRKMLSEIAISDPEQFKALIATANKALAVKAPSGARPSASAVAATAPKAANVLVAKSETAVKATPAVAAKQ